MPSRTGTGLRRTGVDSEPNQIVSQAAIYSPWHDLLTAALGLTHLLEREMDHALAIACLTVREFAALLAIRQRPSEAVGPSALGRKAPAAASGSGGASALGREPPASAEVTQRELAERLGLSRGATNELVGRLERRGLVRCARRPAAGRRGRPEVTVALTTRGNAALAAAARIARKVEDDWIKRMAGPEAAFVSARGNGLRRWLTESLAALRAQPRPRHRGG